MVRPLGHRLARLLYLFVFLLGVSLVLPQAERFATTFTRFFHWEGLLAYALAGLNVVGDTVAVEIF